MEKKNFNKKIIIYLVIVLLMPFFSLPLFGQDFGDSKDFFKNNFANTPLDNDVSKGYNKKSDFFAPNENLFDNHPTLNKNKRAKNKYKARDNRKNENFDEDNNKKIKSGDKIISVGMIVNGLEEKHLEKSLNNLIKTVDKYDLDIGTVLPIGFSSKFSHYYSGSGISTTMAIVARKGTIEQIAAPPAEYNITLSPTWVLQLQDGLVLLDGVHKIDKYINRRGEFVAKGVPSNEAVEDPVIPQSKSLFE